MLEREFPKTDRLRAARSSVSIASRTSAAPVERRLVTQSDGTDQSDGTSLIVALMQSSASCAHPCSWLMLENASRSYRCTCSAHACTAFSLFTHRSSRLQLSLASVHPRSSWRTFCVHRCSSFYRERVACVTLKYAPFMLPCSRTPCAHRRSFLQQPCAHRRSCLKQPCAHSSCTHRPSSTRSSYQASCVHPRSSWRTSCVRRCSSMLMLENAFRVCYAQVRSLYAPLLENACAHRRSCLQQP
jgi:hypothetical protein